MSPDNQPAKLVYMANQIGRGFAARPHDEAVAEIADHIKKFWEKRMLARIFEHLAAGGAGLDERPKQALHILAAKTPVPQPSF
jgi:formate dehydrogenase subunit delta